MNIVKHKQIRFDGEVPSPHKRRRPLISSVRRELLSTNSVRSGERFRRIDTF
jgi:hypothetical protein